MRKEQKNKKVKKGTKKVKFTDVQQGFKKKKKGGKQSRQFRQGFRTKLRAVKKRIHKSKKTRKVYDFFVRVVLVLMFFIGLYLIVYPFLPGILFKLLYEGKEIYPYKTRLEEVESDIKSENEKIPEENRLVLPTINVDMPIVEGLDRNVLNLGVWHRPGTGYPGFGNMVLTGHRVGYAFLPEDVRNSTSFYNLDKLKIDDYVIVYWEGKEYDYKITDSEVVDRYATYIEVQGGKEKLTLYTCHPIGQNAHRLVYYAKRILRDNKDV